MAGRIDRETLRNASPEILPVLIRHLPAGQLDRALELARNLADPALRAQALAAMYIRTSDRALVDEAIRASSGMELGREYALLELAEQLPAEARGGAIETALGSTVNEDEFGYALEWALRIAPAELLPKLTTYLARVTDRGYRVTAFRAVGVRVADLDRATREAVVAEARATKPRTRTAALAAIAALLDPAERDGLVKLSLRRAHREPPDLTLAASLVPWWPEPERLSLLEQWLTWEGYDEHDLEEPLLGSIEPAGIEGVVSWLRPAFQAGQVNATSLAAVAARLTEDGQLRVLALARAMHRGEPRSDMLAELVSVVRPSALRSALIAARNGHARKDWARALSIAASSVDRSLVPLAADILRTARGRSTSVRGLAGLAGRAEGSRRRALVSEVIGELAAAGPEVADSVVSDLAPILTSDEAAAIAGIVLERFSLEDQPWILSPLADVLTGPAFARLLEDVAPTSGEAVAGLVSTRKRLLSAGAYRRAVHLAMRIPDVGISARVLSDLTMMPGQMADAPTPEAVLDMALRSSDDNVIEQVITTLAAHLPVTVAHAAARKVREPYLRRGALEAVLPYVPDDDAAAIRREIARLPEGGKGAGGGDAGEQSLSESLGSLSPIDAGSAASALLGALDGSPTATAARLPTMPPERTAEASRALHNAPPRSAGVVSTGFADVEEPMRSLDPDVTLAAARRYLFWFELGAPVVGSIEAAPVHLMVPAGSVRLVVLLYSPDGDIDVGTGRGEFETGPDGSFMAAPGSGDGWYQAGGKRIGIAVSMPARPGVVRLRCSVLAHGVLLQSRLITAHLTDEPRRRTRALRSVLDYDIAPSLQAASVADRVPHALSILLNEAGDSHTFYFAGGGDDPKLVGGADISPLVIQSVVNEARDALRLASWGSDAEWDGQAPYAYEKPGEADQLRTDLVRFANRGYALYNTLLEALGYPNEAELCALLHLPTFIQMAHVADPRLILPIAMVYDRNLDTGLDPATVKLCPEFLAALAKKQELQATSCWKGACPSAGKDEVVCPSGFWGFRHAIGVPPSFRGRTAARRIARSAPVSAVAAVSTDPAFHRWAEHAKVLQDLDPHIAWTFAFDRDDALTKIVDRSPQLVYFYCHGGVANERPYLRVGSAEGPLIFGETFRDKHIEWADPRPIVLVNGCHTTALGPDVVQPLVSGLMFTANAAGVIGTEVTIFEPLAVEFAEAFLREFDAGSMLGWAVRDARLALLGRGNPLGLVYIPYAAADLELA